MTFFGTRRARPTRLYRSAPTLREKVNAWAQDDHFLTLLLVALLAVLFLLLSIQPWQSRFPWRVGDISSTGIQARVDFRVENIVATRQAQQTAAADARLVFVQDNSVLPTIAATLKNDLAIVANAQSLEELKTTHPDVVEAFGLETPVAGDVEKGISPSTRFEQVKLALSDQSMSIGERVDQMALEFATLLSRLQLVGILDSEARKAIELPESRLHPLQPIEIVSPDGELISSNLLVDVTLEDQLRATGRLGSEWARLPNLQQIRPAVESWLKKRLRGLLSFDAKRTADRQREAIDLVGRQYDAFVAGRVLVEAGTIIERADIELLRQEHAAWDAQVTFSQRLISVGGAALVILLLVMIVGMYLSHRESHLLSKPRSLVALILFVSVAVCTSGFFSIDPWRAEIIPAVAAVIIIAIVHNQALAVICGFVTCLLITVSTTGQLLHFVSLMLPCLVAVVPLKNISTRSTLIKAGFLLSVFSFVVVWGASVIRANEFADAATHPEIVVVALKFCGWTLVCSFLVQGSLPFVESLFGVVTDISLLELSDVSHPLLQELARLAPGTYNHSVTVATIGEAAADAIGANGLLVRVGAYFHDIGKMAKPEYFIENMIEGQQNPHSKLTPAMSALIIIGHVKDGIEMAHQHNLPQRLVDFIEQHHGTTLVEYFFREAANRADEDHRTDAEESSFRYPGPRPQTRETAVMMLADAVESASRSLSEPTPKRIQSLVKEITLKRLMDGQFDECGITMSELRSVQESLVKSVVAVHHGRIRYPDQKTA